MVKKNRTIKLNMYNNKIINKKRNILLIGIREINNDLPIDELLYYLAMKFSTMKKMIQFFLQVLKFIQDTGRFTIN